MNGSDKSRKRRPSRRGRTVAGSRRDDGRRGDRIQPFRQGELDSLCGVYAVVNAARLLCPEVNKDVSESLFEVLVETLSTSELDPHETITWGMESPALWLLIKAAQDFLRGYLDIRIQANTVTLQRVRRQFDELWSTLQNHIDGDRVAIIGLSGRHEHWTVAHRVTRKTIRLFDSDFMKVLLRSHCSIRSRKVSHQIDPEDVVLLHRERSRS